jgi:hypothetical protein
MIGKVGTKIPTFFVTADKILLTMRFYSYLVIQDLKCASWKYFSFYECIKFCQFVQLKFTAIKTG